MNDSPLSPVEPDDTPRGFCSKHHNKYNPYSGGCWPCTRSEIHEKARDEWSEIKRQRVDVTLTPLPDSGMIPTQFDGDAYVEWQGQSRILSIHEVESDRNAHRTFTIEGGLPADWLEDELTEAIASELSGRMLALVDLQ